MIASELIIEKIPALQVNETCEQALDWMNEFKVSHLPLVKGGFLLGIVNEAELLQQEDKSYSIEESDLSMLNASVFDYQHILNVMKIMSDNNISIIPIIDRENNYLGATSLSHLMKLTGNSTSIQESGGVIVLEIAEREYSLSEIAQIVESNNARILSMYITSSEDSVKMEVTLKINKSDLGAILQTFGRYNYTIVETHQKENEEKEILENRYNHLMRMLDL